MTPEPKNRWMSERKEKFKYKNKMSMLLFVARGSLLLTFHEPVVKRSYQADWTIITIYITKTYMFFSLFSHARFHGIL